MITYRGFPHSLVLSLAILLGCVPSGILADGTEASHRYDASLSNGEASLAVTGTTHHGTTTSQSDTALSQELSTETIWFGSGEEVSVATRRETPIIKAPSIVTVITAEEIKNAGYRTFVEILGTVPGFELLKSADRGITKVSVRGFVDDDKIRVMINGHYVNNSWKEGALSNLDDYPVHNIKRIEIIRGPGSALYGENAFLGVINIITFDAKDIEGVRVSSGYGSFGTYDEDVVFGKTYGKGSISGMLRYKQTDGYDGIVKSDFQTILDNSYGTDASLAPGEVHDGRQEYDMDLKATYNDFYFQGWYSNKNMGPFIGADLALNDKTDLEYNYVFAEVGYKKTWEEQFTVRPRIYYDQYDSNEYWGVLPDGFTYPPAYKYPDGFNLNTTWNIKSAGAETLFDYEVFEGNTATLGLEYRYMMMRDLRYLTNANPFTLEPLDSLQNYADKIFDDGGDVTRTVRSVCLQDTWDITKTLNVTLGVRHDQYDGTRSDFGGQTSPRAGLTWAFLSNASLKLLYGEAFRIPNFSETMATPLSPEEIKTYEIGLSYTFNKHVKSNVNYFYNSISDYIGYHSLTYNAYENEADAHIQGVETETRVDISKGNYVFMNYTFQNPEDSHGDDLPFVAQHYGNFGVNVHYWRYINTNLSTFVSGTRSREKDDTRDGLPGYALLNLSVIGKEFFKTMEVQGSVFNLLDKDYSDPGPALMPDDLPRPGRSFFVGLSYQF